MPITSKAKRLSRAPRPPKPVPPDAITIGVAQAVAISGLSRMGVYNLIKAGKLKAHKVGARTLIDVKEFRRVLGV